MLTIVQRLPRERDQLSLRAQEAPFQAARTRPHQGNHTAVSSQGHLPSPVHRRRRPSHSGVHMPVCRLAVSSYLCPHSAPLPRYYHRSLNIPKLVDVKFTYVPRHLTLARMIRSNKLPAVPQLARASAGLREMEDRDIAEVGEMHTRYIQRFGMSPVMTLDELRHQFLSGRGRGDRAPGVWKGRREGQVIWAYVVEVRRLSMSMPTSIWSQRHPACRTHTRTRSQTFSRSTPCRRPSSGMQSTPRSKRRTCSITPPTSLSSTAPRRMAGSGNACKSWWETRSSSLIRCVLLSCHLTPHPCEPTPAGAQAKFDVFNALTLMDNNDFLQDLKVTFRTGSLSVAQWPTDV